MTIPKYIEEKMSYMLFQMGFLLLLNIYLSLLKVPLSILLLLDSILLLTLISYLIFDYQKKKRQYDKIHQLVDGLSEKYLIAEILKKPKSLESEAYYYALKRACKAMNDKISEIETDQKEYQEYIESFAHEIKTPIAALLLYADNEQNKKVKKEVKKINAYIEQVLYYARSENPEKDYFVQENCLAEMIHPLLLEAKDVLLEQKITLKIHDLDTMVYTDRKWLTFILSQILQNAIKYMDKPKKEIAIYSIEEKGAVSLIIEDNGIGITQSDLPRLFEKGFTGNNRGNTQATGIGLYLCKKLCDKLHLQIIVESEEQQYTRVKITFPKSSMYK